MVLAVDIGNTNIVVGCFLGEQWLFTERISTVPNATAAEYTVSLKMLLELHSIPPQQIEGCILSSVVPPVSQTIQAAVLRLLGKSPLIVGAGIKTGLKILLDNPAAVGSDRVADAVAASTDYPCPVITVDLGTATTLSVVDENKVFRGGAIIPGVRVALDSLSGHASQLPVIALSTPKRAIATSTIECMKSGIIFSTAAAIDGMTARMEEELGKPCTVVATGGNAGLIVPHCKRKIILDEQLLLRGLMLLYQKNCRKKAEKSSENRDFHSKDSPA